MSKSQFDSPAVVSNDPFVEARLHGLDRRQQVLEAEGGTLSVEQVAAYLGLTRQAVDKRDARASSLPWRQADGVTPILPAWQLAQPGTLPGLEEVLAGLSVREPC